MADVLQHTHVGTLIQDQVDGHNMASLTNRMCDEWWSWKTVRIVDKNSPTILTTCHSMYDVTYYEYYVFNWVSDESLFTTLNFPESTDRPKLASVDKLLFFVAVGIIKMSITVFNMRLTGLSSPRWMIAHWSFLALLIMYTLLAFFLNIFQCIPISGNFDTIAAGHLNTAPKCISDSELGTILSTIHVVMDFCLLAVPIIVLWKVQMSRKAKWRLYAVFSVGGLSFIGSIIRQYEQAKLSADVLCWFSSPIHSTTQLKSLSREFHRRPGMVSG